MFFRACTVLILEANCVYALQGPQVVLDYSTLVEPNIDAAEQELKTQLGLSADPGFWSKWSSRLSLATYLTTNGLPLLQSSIQQSFFALLRLTDADTDAPTVIHELSGFPEYPDPSTILPPLMCKQWLTRTDCATIIEHFAAFLKTVKLTSKQKEQALLGALAPDNKLTREQQDFYLAVARAAFVAAIYAKTSKINQEAREFIAACRKHDAHVYLMGNMNGECFLALKKRLSDPKNPDYCEEFANLDEKHGYFSFTDGLLKPTPAFYVGFKSHCHITPESPTFCLESRASRSHADASREHLTAQTFVASREAFSAILAELAKKREKTA